MRTRAALCVWMLAGCAAERPCGLDLDAAECAVVMAMRRGKEPPPSFGNAVADDERAAELGFVVFFDARFSADQNVRCATCHEPERAFADGRKTAIGLATVARNSPTVLDVATSYRWFFWDGRADSLWSQPLFAFEHPREMGFSRLAIAHRIAKSFRAEYEAAFGALPPLEDELRFPLAGSPGDAVYDAMAMEDKVVIDRLVANVGKSLEAYMRKLVTGPSPFDRFLAGETDALDASAQRGLSLFVRTGCASCHSGAMLTDGAFHNIGLGSDAAGERGRADAHAILEGSVFTALGPYYDGAVPSDFPATPADTDLGAFRTPSLRHASQTAPYGHDGRFETLASVIAFHLAPKAGSQYGTIDPLLRTGTLTDAEMADLVAFLGALEGEPPPLPWSDWPNR